MPVTTMRLLLARCGCGNAITTDLPEQCPTCRIPWSHVRVPPSGALPGDLAQEIARQVSVVRLPAQGMLLLRIPEGKPVPPPDFVQTLQAHFKSLGAPHVTVAMVPEHLGVEALDVVTMELFGWQPAQPVETLDDLPYRHRLRRDFGLDHRRQMDTPALVARLQELVAKGLAWEKEQE